MTKEVFIKFICETSKEIGRHYDLEKLKGMTIGELKKEADWLEYLAGK